ncbi:hypothetical protein RUMCAL_01802 [Ruminococcus callidus ATCC 27760]|uniref:Uncharacterized protein n=1 Tax=Ruminococcus callidus ATCC 27760 TaxID=411473 RepID=U2LZJ6_9FIRM|nr:hypothetical protein RUMCAL_01802 [Ruminococcus callidus ATCC 27760]
MFSHGDSSSCDVKKVIALEPVSYFRKHCTQIACSVSLIIAKINSGFLIQFLCVLIRFLEKHRAKLVVRCVVRFFGRLRTKPSGGLYAVLP